MTAIMLSLVRLYQRSLSLLLPNVCRFSPTCSEYVAQAIQKHGALRGGVMGMHRILRCQPFCAGGYDPVP